MFFLAYWKDQKTLKSWLVRLGVVLWALHASTAIADDVAPDPPAAPPPVHKLKLQDIWRYAEVHHPTVRANHEAVNSARYTRDEQRWLALPSGDMNAYMTWSPD